MNSINGINATTQNVTFGNKITKAQQEVLNAIEKNQEKIALERMRKEFPEEYKIVMRNRIMSEVLKSVNQIFSPKNLIKMEFNIMTTRMAIGLGKFLGKCDKTLNKIPFIKNAKDKQYAKFEETVNQRFKDGVIDADEAGEMLTRIRPKTTKI